MTTIIPIPLKWSNAYLIKGERPILVDTGSPGETAQIIRAMSKVKVAPQQLALILHTHGHHDHCGSTWEMKRLSQAPLAIHQADHEWLQSGRNGEFVPTRFSARLIKQLLARSKFQGVGANVIIQDEISLETYGVAGKILFTPGHTLGSISVLLDNGEAIIGDLLMGGYLGGQIQSNQPRYHYFAYDLTVVDWSLKKLFKHQPTKLYVGHGGPLDAEAVQTKFKVFD